MSRCGHGVRPAGFPAMSPAMAFGVAVLIEHFCLFPRLLFATQGAAEGKRESGESKILFHGTHTVRDGLKVALQPEMGSHLCG